MRNYQRIALLLVIICTVAFVWFSRTNEQSFPAKTFSARSADKKIQSKRKSVSLPKKERPFSTQWDCQKELMKKVAGNCDRVCILKALKIDPELTLYFAEGAFDAALSDSVEKKYKSKLIRFYRGKVGMQEIKVREKYLKELSEEDKENAFPAVNYAYLLWETNRIPEARKVLVEALTRKEYRNYVTDLQFRLKKATVQDPRLYAAANYLLGDELTPTSAYDLINLEVLGEDLYLQLGKKLVHQAIVDEGKNADLKWSSIDFDLGYRIIEENFPSEMSALKEIDDVVEREKDQYLDYDFDCNAKSYNDYRLREAERIQNL